MEKNICMFYITCYSYKNLWEPFLKLRDKYFTNKIKCYMCVDKMDLNDELKILIEKKYSNIKFLIFNEVSNIKTNGNYFNRYLYYLDNISEDLIIYMYDDMLFSKKIDMNEFFDTCKLINETDEIKMIKLLYYNLPQKENIYYSNNSLQFSLFNNLKDHYIISGQPHIIKKNIFIDISNYCLKHIVKQIEYCGPQVYEVYGTQFFRDKKYLCLTIYKKNLFHIFRDEGAVYGCVKHGQISNDTLQILKDKENIIINSYNNFICKIDKEVIENSSHIYLETINKIKK